MERPTARDLRDEAEELPYEGEYYQPISEVYRKQEADAYFNHLENRIKELEGKHLSGIEF